MCVVGCFHALGSVVVVRKACVALICCLNFGVHHAFRGLGVFSYRSIVRCIAVWILIRCCPVVVFSSVELCFDDL